MLQQQPAEQDEIAVARGVSQSVVDQFEAIDIEQDHRGLELVAVAARELGIEPLLYRATVEQAGDLVGSSRALQPLDQLGVLERDRRGERQGGGELPLGAAIHQLVEPRSQYHQREPFAPRVQRDHQLGPRGQQAAERDVADIANPASDRQCRMEPRFLDRLRHPGLVERTVPFRLVVSPLGSVQTGPPREKHLGHEIEHQVLAVFGRVDRGEQAGHLPQGAQLEEGIVERRLALLQHAAELQHHAQPDRQGERRRPQRRCERWGGQNRELGFAARGAAHLDRLRKAFGAADTVALRATADHGEPDLIVLEPLHQHLAAALEELRIAARYQASRGERARQGGEAGDQRGWHAKK